MSEAKAGLGPSLRETELLSGDQAARLEALSVTTVEELLGLIAADSEAVASFLEADLDFGGLASGAVMRVGRELAGAQEPAESLLPLGALPPEGIEVEEWASVETFAAYAVRIVGEAPSGPALVAGAAQAEAEPPPVLIVDCFGAVRSQGKRLTCVAQAVCSLLECLRSSEARARSTSPSSSLIGTPSGTTGTRTREGRSSGQP